MLDIVSRQRDIVELSISLTCKRRESGMAITCQDYHSKLVDLSIQMAREEVNVLDMTDRMVLYEFSYIDQNKMKKWAKRLVPVSSSIPGTYEAMLRQVHDVRRKLGQ